MKRILFITYLFTMLLALGNKTHANVPKIAIASISNWSLSSEDQNQFINLNHSSTFLEYSDFDLDEEFSGCNNLRENKLLHVKHPFLDKWYLSYDDSQEVTYCYNLTYNCKPISGQSTPIYITQSVLRI